MHEEYPKWVKVEGPGHPQNPGFVLVENEDQELEVLSGGEAPRDLNPEAAEKPEPEGEKEIDEMGRDDLVAALVKESITDDVTDGQLRDSLKRLRERREPEPDDKAAGNGEPLKDAEGKDVPPPVDQEANKGGDLGEEGRKLPEAKPAAATQAVPDEAKEKVADDKPAGNITEAAATPPEHKKGARKPAN